MTRCITGFIVVTPIHDRDTMFVALNQIAYYGTLQGGDYGFISLSNGKGIDVKESQEQITDLIRQAQADLRNGGLISAPNSPSPITMVGRIIAFQPLGHRGEVLLSLWNRGVRTMEHAVDIACKVAHQTKQTVKDVIGTIVEDGGLDGELGFFHLVLDLGQRCDQLGLSSQISPEAPLDVIIPEMLGLIESYKKAAVEGSH